MKIINSLIENKGVNSKSIVDLSIFTKQSEFNMM